MKFACFNIFCTMAVSCDNLKFISFPALMYPIMDRIGTSQKNTINAVLLSWKNSKYLITPVNPITPCIQAATSITLYKKIYFVSKIHVARTKSAYEEFKFSTLVE